MDLLHAWTTRKVRAARESSGVAGLLPTPPAHDLTAFKFNSHFPMNTLTLMRMAASVELDAPDQLRAFFDAGFVGMWELDRDFTQDEVIRAHFSDAGFDADRLLARTSDTEVKAHLKKNHKLKKKEHSERYRAERKRNNYVTPKNYLDFIANYK